MSFRIVFAREHVGVGHARHGNVLVAFTTAIARVRDTHQPGGKLVAEIALQDSVLDQHGFLRGLAFVIDVERAATPRHGAVVDYRALLAGHSSADQAGKG